MTNQGDQKVESACSEALGALRPDALDDIFETVYTLLGDMATTLKEPRTLTLNLQHLQSLAGWKR